MESTPGETGGDAASRIDYEILRLKRELGSDDAKGHSCEHCNGFRLKPPPESDSAWKQQTEYKFFEVHTTGRKVRDLAETGCDFWIMIRDQLTYIDLKAMVEQEQDKVAFNPEKHRSRYSDEHCKDLAASLGGNEGEEFWRLHRERGVYWFYPMAVGAIGFNITEADFVLIRMGYTPSSKPITVAVELIIPKKPVQTSPTLFPVRTARELRLVKYWTEFLPLQLPGMFGNDGADISRNIFGSPINLMPESPSTVALIKQWLKKCEVEHGCGISLPPSQMPSMILDVSDQDKIKLVRVPQDLRERYISLSYCWGKGSQSVMLNKSNQSDLASGVSVRQLDPTIRDSITVTRQLGFRYLWIDALCIFQDDYEFKARELGRMGEIYRDATFTIVASAAKDVNDGFLTKRKPNLTTTSSKYGIPGPVFKGRFEGDENSIAASSVTLRPHMFDKVEPWYDRAWTLQEMLFSGRRLQYRAKQTTWVCYCSEKFAQQCDGWVPGEGNTLRSLFNQSDVSELFVNAMAILRKGNSIPPDAKVLPTWYGLVAEYTSRKLTYPTDRLPAISGIAKEFGSALGDQYVCGLWKSDLPLGLIWSPRQRSQHTSDSRSGPSWSWVSHEKAIRWEYEREDRWANPDFEVLGIMVDLASPSEPFGEIKTAELHVRGLFMFSSPQARTQDGTIRLTLEDDVSVMVFFDYTNDPRVKPGSGFELGLLVVFDEGQTGVGGLVLVKEEEEQYSRVGYFFVAIRQPWEYFKNGHEISKTERSPEECQARVRSLWGGEENIREIVLV